jgi:hypothetical protein
MLHRISLFSQFLSKSKLLIAFRHGLRATEIADLEW